MSDLVSIIIPYYKKKKFFKKTINSVINQSYKNFEIILIYDDVNKLDLKFINFTLKKIKNSQQASVQFNKLIKSESGNELMKKAAQSQLKIMAWEKETKGAS